MPSLETLIGHLAANHVEMIVVGALAAVAQGAPISTHDLDIVHRRSDDNIGRLVTALLAIDARYRGRDDVLGPTAEILRGTGHSLLQTSLGPLDVLGAIEGGLDYDALLPDTIELSIGGAPVRLLGLAKIVDIKRTSTRPKDVQNLPMLEATLRRRSSPGHTGGRWIAFEYRDFCDVPRCIVARLAGGALLLDAPFLDSTDEYDDHYTVFRLPRDVDLTGDWAHLRDGAGPPLGRVAVASVRFDESKRQQLDLDGVGHVLPEDLR